MALEIFPFQPADSKDWSSVQQQSFIRHAVSKTKEAYPDLSKLKRELEKAHRERDQANLDRDKAAIDRDQVVLEEDTVILGRLFES